MRGFKANQSTMFSTLTPAERVPKNHPLRRIDAMIAPMLQALDPVFGGMYSRLGRESIPPERLLRAMLLQIFFTVRSERLLCEMIEYNLLFRWFLGMNADDKVFHHSVFSHNRDRLIDHDVAREFFAQVMRLAREYDLLSDEHFTVDGTLIEAWAGHKSFKRKDGTDDKPDGDFRGETRANDTHASTTDPESRLYRKGLGKEAKLCFMGNVVMENRSNLPVDSRVSIIDGAIERTDCADMLQRKAKAHGGPITAGGDKAFDTRGFVDDCRTHGITPHVAQNHKRSGGSAIDARTTRHPGYEISQNKRKGIERIFGWGKTIGPLRKTKLRGRVRNDWQFSFVSAAYCLVRFIKLIAAPA